MSEKILKVEEAAKTKEFSCRNIKKEFTKFQSGESVTPEFHIELGDNNETVIVEDRPTDWIELANRDADKVGLINVLQTIERQGLDVRQACRFDDREAVDTSSLDPMNPHVYSDAVQAKDESYEKLQETAKVLGVSVDGLISAAISGSLDKLIAEKTAAKQKEEEGGSK